MAQLFVRPGRNDHLVVADLLAAGSGTFRDEPPPVDVLVVDATTALRQPAFAEKASHAGIPLLIDPTTPLLQDQQRPEDAWVKLPYARESPVEPADLVQDVGTLTALGRKIVEDCVDFQIDHGATRIIPPYVYVRRADDGWMPVQIAIWRAVAEMGIRQQLMPLLALNLLQAGQPGQTQQVVEPALTALRDLHASQMALALSWREQGGIKDGYDRLQRAFDLTRIVATSGVEVVAWRQGIYGLALTAAGAAGYETGIGTAERCNISDQLARRRPQTKPDSEKRSGGGAAGIYLELLHRSVTGKQARALFSAPGMLGQLVCTTGGRCCPDGITSMLEDPRPHAVRARAKQLRDLNAIKNPQWRLNQVARDAERGANLAVQANRVLKNSDLNMIHAANGLTAIAQVADHLRQDTDHAVA